MIIILSILILVFIMKKIRDYFRPQIKTIPQETIELKTVPEFDYKEQVKEYLYREEEPNYLNNNIFFGTYDRPEHPCIQVL
jgi:hypothetical protein